jgi:hypothetical protein
MVLWDKMSQKGISSNMWRTEGRRRRDPWRRRKPEGACEWRRWAKRERSAEKGTRGAGGGGGEGPRHTSIARSETLDALVDLLLAPDQGASSDKGTVLFLIGPSMKVNNQRKNIYLVQYYFRHKLAPAQNICASAAAYNTGRKQIQIASGEHTKGTTTGFASNRCGS